MSDENLIKKTVVCVLENNPPWGFQCHLAYYPTSQVAMITEYGMRSDVKRLDTLNFLCDYLRKEHQLSYEKAIWVERVSKNAESLITMDDCFNLICVHNTNDKSQVTGWRALTWDEVESVVLPVWPEYFAE